MRPRHRSQRRRCPEPRRRGTGVNRAVNVIVTHKAGSRSKASSHTQRVRPRSAAIPGTQRAAAPSPVFDLDDAPAGAAATAGSERGRLPFGGLGARKTASLVFGARPLRTPLDRNVHSAVAGGVQLHSLLNPTTQSTDTAAAAAATSATPDEARSSFGGAPATRPAVSLESALFGGGSSSIQSVARAAAAAAAAAADSRAALDALIFSASGQGAAHAGGPAYSAPAGAGGAGGARAYSRYDPSTWGSKPLPAGPAQRLAPRAGKSPGMFGGASPQGPLQGPVGPRPQMPAVRELPALDLNDTQGRPMARDAKPLNSGATCDVWGYSTQDGQRHAVKIIRHGKRPHECRNSVEQLRLLSEHLCRLGVLIPTNVLPCSAKQTALIMSEGVDMFPDGEVEPLAVADRTAALQVMATAAQWLDTQDLGYVDFKLENLVSVDGRPYCVDMIENVLRQDQQGSIHTFRMYRLLGHAERPIAEPVRIAAVRANPETMLFMIACTLLQMVACDRLAASEGRDESQIFRGLPEAARFTEAEAILLNFAFFDPDLRARLTPANFVQLFGDPSKTAAADFAWIGNVRRVEQIR